MTQAKLEKIEGILSDGSEYIHYIDGIQHIYKDVTVNNVLFTVCRLSDKVLEDPKVKHIYTLTAGKDHQEWACVTLDANLDKVVSYLADGLGYKEEEYVILDYPHDTILRVEEPQVTFGMFVQAVKDADIFDFNHPEILKILGEVPNEVL